MHHVTVGRPARDGVVLDDTAVLGSAVRDEKPPLTARPRFLPRSPSRRTAIRGDGRREFTDAFIGACLGDVTFHSASRLSGMVIMFVMSVPFPFSRLLNDAERHGRAV
jgi:hypothetical protein